MNARGGSLGLAAVGIWLALSGCAAMLHGKAQSVGVNSIPQGADIRVDGEPRGRTPAMLRLDRGRDHMVRLDDGHGGFVERKLERGIASSIWLNLVSPGGLAGFVVDAASGAMYELTPDTLWVPLPGRAEPDPGAATMRVEREPDSGPVLRTSSLLAFAGAFACGVWGTVSTTDRQLVERYAASVSLDVLTVVLLAQGIKHSGDVVVTEEAYDDAGAGRVR